MLGPGLSFGGASLTSGSFGLASFGVFGSFSAIVWRVVATAVYAAVVGSWVAALKFRKILWVLTTSGSLSMVAHSFCSARYSA